MFDKLLALVGREPTLAIGLVNALLVVGVTFGLHLPTDTTAAIDGALIAAAALWTRSQVTPAP